MRKFQRLVEFQRRQQTKCRGLTFRKTPTWKSNACINGNAAPRTLSIDCTGGVARRQFVSMQLESMQQRSPLLYFRATWGDLRLRFHLQS
mmetsp:Transcript_2545/g.4362  ORF Transcript_2545/g.4362 Transcript_2545/m.4362 type:complete len:90 (-) Transcript_2545:48-317(-)